MNPNTDIVIPVHADRTFPAETFFVDCVRTVEKFTTNYRFIFVDDACDDVAKEVIKTTTTGFTESTLIQTRKQLWFTRAVNLGLRLVRTPYCVVLNCDCVVDNGWLEELYAVKDEVTATVGKVGLVGSVLSGDEPRRYQYENMSWGHDYVTGHAWLLNMEAMQEASVNHQTPGLYLDETKPGLIHIHSDNHICWELNQLGWQCVKAFKSAVGHHGGKSWGQILGLIPQTLEAVNYRY